jgi:hypothetical protein
MRDRSEEQILSRLLELENSDQAERRAELTGERFLSLIHDPDTARGYVIRHGTDETEGAEIPPGTEFWEYSNIDEASQAYEALLNEARSIGELVEEDSEEDLGDSETDGAEVRDRYSDSDGDLLIEGDETEEPDETSA